jgi:hypothetical protein
MRARVVRGAPACGLGWCGGHLHAGLGGGGACLHAGLALEELAHGLVAHLAPQGGREAMVGGAWAAGLRAAGLSVLKVRGRVRGSHVGTAWGHGHRLGTRPRGWG